jgi:hypothetical protein
VLGAVAQLDREVPAVGVQGAVCSVGHLDQVLGAVGDPADGEW